MVLLFLLLVPLAPEIRWDPPYPDNEKQGYGLTSHLNDHPVLNVSFLRVNVTKGEVRTKAPFTVRLRPTQTLTTQNHPRGELWLMTINQFSLTPQGDNPRIFPNGQPSCAITNGKNELCRPSMTMKQGLVTTRQQQQKNNAVD